MYAKGPSLSRKGDKQVMYDGMVPGETGYLASMVCVWGGGGRVHQSFGHGPKIPPWMHRPKFSNFLIEVVLGVSYLLVPPY